VPPDAQRRIQALVEYADLGSGFQIALKDLEIRGAGNILGAEQSGHIAQVGYDMYARLLARAVRRLRSEPASEPVEVEVDLEIEAFIPEDYLAGEAAKIEVYRRISTAASEPALADIGRELDDRFGPYPREVERLLDVQRLRLRAAAAGVEHVGRKDDNLVLKGEGGLQALLAGCPTRVAILDPRTAAVSLRDPRRRHAPPIDDERAFRIALEWLGTGKFPEPGARVGAAASRAT
jgi:transcription-repair coupling factor (superfamily II helicase)